MALWRRMIMTCSEKGDAAAILILFIHINSVVNLIIQLLVKHPPLNTISIIRRCRQCGQRIECIY